MYLVLTRVFRRLLNGISDGAIHTIIVISRECVFTFTFRISDRAAFIASRFRFHIASNDRQINGSEGTNSANYTSAFRVSIVGPRLRYFVHVFIIRMIGSLRDVSVGFYRPTRRLLMFLRRFIMVRVLTNSQFRAKDRLRAQFLIASTVSHVRRTLYRINADSRVLRLLASLRQERATNSAMVITVIQARRVIILMLSNENVSQCFYTRIFPIVQDVIRPGRHRIKFKYQTRIVRNVRVAMEYLYRRQATIGALSTRQFDRPGEITKRRIIMFQDARRASGARFSGGLISRFLYLFFHRLTFTGVFFSVSVRRDEDASRERNYSVLVLCNYRMDRVRRLRNFTNVLYQAYRIRAVANARSLGYFRHFSLLHCLLAALGSFFYRFLCVRAFLRAFLFFSRSLNSMRECAAMVASSASTSMNVERPNGSNKAAYHGRLIYVN